MKSRFTRVMPRLRLGTVFFTRTFWAEALSTATYVINRSPSVPLDGDSPQKVWTSKEVSSRHLKVFGCLAYVHVAKDWTGKLDPKTQPCIFLGYGDDEFGYRVWDPVDKVFRSRDIIFMEDKTLADWESEKKRKNSEEVWSKPTESRLTLEEPTGSDEEEILEPVAESQGR